MPNDNHITGFDRQSSSGALGFVGAMTDLKKKTTPGGTLYVFALPKT
jgi:hypothetical protein